MATTTLVLRADNPSARKRGNMLYDEDGELERYDLDELADHTGLSPRVIRQAEEEDLRVWCDELDILRRENFVGFCAKCEDDIVLGEEFCRGTIRVAADLPGGGMSFDFLRDADGTISVGSMFLCESCWEAIRGELKDMHRDVPPVQDIPNTALRCEGCRGGICSGEPHAQFWLTEASPTVPPLTPVVGGDISPPIREYELRGKRPDLICAHCIAMMHTECDVTWEGDFSRENECVECTKNMCWRDEEECGCDCHT